MTVDIFNVGHGEAIQINMENINQRIIRDLGRSKNAQNTSTSITLPLLTRLLPVLYNQDKPTDAVLSHAHEDHFNGFKELYDNGARKIFENGYIPILRMQDLQQLGGVLIKISILIYRYYSPNSQYAKNAGHWLLATPIMAALSKKLWCVQQGHQVQHWVQPNKFLWPVSSITDHTLKELWNEFLLENDLPENFLEEFADEIRQILSQFHEPTDQTLNNIDGVGTEFNTDEIEEIINNIVDILNRVQLPNLSIPPMKLYAKAYRTYDNHSLVFELGDKEHDVLFLSDADDSMVNRMLSLNGITNHSYKLIKAGHHGNKGAKPLFGEKITSDIAISCCGPAHPNWKGPDIAYQKISKKLHCTDWNNHGKKWKNKASFTILKNTVTTYSV